MKVRKVWVGLMGMCSVARGFVCPFHLRGVGKGASDFVPSHRAKTTSLPFTFWPNWSKHRILCASGGVCSIAGEWVWRPKHVCLLLIVKLIHRLGRLFRNAKVGLDVLSVSVVCSMGGGKLDCVHFGQVVRAVLHHGSIVQTVKDLCTSCRERIGVRMWGACATKRRGRV